MKKTLIYFIFLTLYFAEVSCQHSPQYLSYKTPLNLENLDWETDIYKYYCESDDVFAAIQNKIVKGEPGKDITVYVDTVRAYWRENDDPSTEKKKVIGLQFQMMGWKHKKYIATFHNQNFTRIDMVTDFNHKLLGICAVDDRNEKIDINELTSLIKKKNNTITIEHQPGSKYFTERDLYIWEEGEYVYIILNELSQVNIGYDPPYCLYFFILQKEHAKDLRKIWMGNFSKI